jgi:uncharacterized protein (DUF2336 family)
MQPPSQTLIAELEASVQSGSSVKRLTTLRRVADLLLSEPDRLDDEQLKLFDDVLCCLIKQVEDMALAELSGRLAAVNRAPQEVIRRLARHDEIAVAGPVLTGSTSLTSPDLADIARTKGQQHLLAISGRDGLEEAVTDVLVERGDREVMVRLAGNTTVRFSEAGYGTLVKRAQNDDLLTETVALRLDVPSRLLPQLLSRATETVRARLLATAPPQMREDISRALATISSAVAAQAATPANPAAVARHVRLLHAQGKLDEAAVLCFAQAGKREELTAALALLASVPFKTIAELLSGLRNDAVLIPCKAAKLGWPTVEAILRSRMSGYAIPDQVLELARNDYGKLSVATAQRALRFMQIRGSVG